MAGGLVSLLAARLLLGLGEGATFPAASTAMSRWVPRKTGLRAGHHPRGGAHRQRGRARRGRSDHGDCAAGANRFMSAARISFLWVVVWALAFTEHPEGSSAHHGRSELARARLAPKPKPRSGRSLAAAAERMAPVTVVYFCYGWTLWLFLSWMPQYFLHSYGLNLKKSALFSSSVFFAGVIGDTLGGVVTDRLLRANRQSAAARAAGWSASAWLPRCVSLIPLLFLHEPPCAVVCLSLGILLRGNDHRPDVGRADGYRARIRRAPRAAS